MSDIIGQAEQELELITNKREAEVFHRRWLGVRGTLRSMALTNPALSHYYRCLYRQWRRRAAG